MIFSANNIFDTEIILKLCLNLPKTRIERIQQNRVLLRKKKQVFHIIRFSDVDKLLLGRQV